MARSFDDNGNGDDQNNEKRKGFVPNGTVPPLEGAVGGQLPTIDDPFESLPRLPTPDEIREEADEGRHLLLDFVRTEISRNGIPVNERCLNVNDVDEDSISPEKCVKCWKALYTMMEWMRTGRELRQLADAFSRSKERDEVRRKAESVPLESLDADYFLQLLQELFQGGGITRERIIVLFYFCADMAIQALRKGLHSIFHRLLEWSIKYISTKVAEWVHSNGGWGMVLRSSLDVVYQISACCAFVAVVAACVVYIRRNI